MLLVKKLYRLIKTTYCGDANNSLLLHYITYNRSLYHITIIALSTIKSQQVKKNMTVFINNEIFVVQKCVQKVINSLCEELIKIVS